MSAEKSFRRKIYPPKKFFPKKNVRGKKIRPKKNSAEKNVSAEKIVFVERNPTRKKSRSGVEDEKHRDTRARHSSNVVSSGPPPGRKKKNEKI